MNRKFILTIILFATLSIVNATPHELHKRASIFTACPKEAPPPVAFNIVITPDPPVNGGLETFEISATPSVDVPPGSLIVAGFGDALGAEGTPGHAEFCSIPGVTCPFPAGTPFNITLQGEAPAVLVENYVILISILNPANSIFTFCVVSTFGAGVPSK